MEGNGDSRWRGLMGIGSRKGVDGEGRKIKLGWNERMGMGQGRGR